MKLIENYVICDDGNIFYHGKLLSLKERCCLAEDTTNPELLEALSQDNHWAVRYWVAWNKLTPIGVAEMLLQDKEVGVQYWANEAIKKKQP